MIYFLLDTSTAVCRMTLVKDGSRHHNEWEAGRQLARDLLPQMFKLLKQHNISIDELDGLGAFRGPGSFTGLRIGLTVLNTIASDQKIPIVGNSGEDWQQQAIARLDSAENDQIVLPIYDRPANISTPRK